MLATGQPAIDLAATPEAERMTTEQMVTLYDVIGFSAPYVVVTRKADGVRGSLVFTHSPRVYFGWRAG
jgi:hypothetical protein